MKRLVSIGMLMLVVTGCAAAAAPKPVDVFVGGQDGYPVYRIPSMVVTKAGTLLAFAEGRASKSDHAENDIVLKRSTDGGATWGTLQVVAEDGKNCLNNPCAVVLEKTGRIILMYQRYPQGRHERQVIEGVSGNLTCLGFVTYSDDDGKTWATPKDITPEIKPARGATSIAGGPGIGIELKRGKFAGRILFPFNCGSKTGSHLYAAYSDDGGATWKFGDYVPEGEDGRGNEVQFVELADGSVMLNARSQSGKIVRKVAASADGGKTWSMLKDDPSLIEPRCQGSILRYSDAGPLIFCNPADAKKRVKGVVRLSEDEGKTWSAGQELYEGSFAYCCLAKLQDGTVGCLFERDDYRAISLSVFDLKWLKEK